MKPSLCQGCVNLEARTHLPDWILRGYPFWGIHLLKENNFSSSQRGFVVEEALSLSSLGYNFRHSPTLSWLPLLSGLGTLALSPCNTSIPHSPHSVVITASVFSGCGHLRCLAYRSFTINIVTVKVAEGKFQPLADISETNKSKSGFQPPFSVLQLIFLRANPVPNTAPVSGDAEGDSSPSCS